LAVIESHSEADVFAGGFLIRQPNFCSARFERRSVLLSHHVADQVIRRIGIAGRNGLSRCDSAGVLFAGFDTLHREP
jgi:hypothetical protein